MKTLENILETAAAEMDGARKVISRMVADSESEGIEWPELEEYEPDHCICGHCDGTGCYICNYSGELYR
jgi:hypothetical protein